MVGVYFGCPFRLNVVRGDSMAPTIRNGSVCVLDEGYYEQHPVRRGDIVTIDVDGELLTKRVYAAEGQTIRLLQWSDGTYDVPNGEWMRRVGRLKSLNRILKPVELTIPAGHCFVVGDNTPVSYDSRAFGPISTDHIVGKMTGIAISGRESAVRASERE